MQLQIVDCRDYVILMKSGFYPFLTSVVGLAIYSARVLLVALFRLDRVAAPAISTLYALIFFYLRRNRIVKANSTASEVKARRDGRRTFSAVSLKIV